MTKIKLAKAVFWFINFLIINLIIWGIVFLFLATPLLITVVFSGFILLALYLWATTVIDEERTEK